MKAKIKNERSEVVTNSKNNEIRKEIREKAPKIKGEVEKDSRYEKNLKLTPPAKNFNIETDWKRANGKYCGSPIYWFNEMKDETNDFKKCVLGSVVSVNRSHKTHLESAAGASKILADRICEICSNYYDLMNQLNEKFEGSDDEDHIFARLCKRVEGENGYAHFCLSFAAKFCANASMYLGAKNQYSKYDSIVSSKLPSYIEVYLEEKLPSSKFKVDDSKLTNEKDKYTSRLKIYKEYSDYIEEIIDKVKEEEKIALTKEEFDHILWYRPKKKKDNNN